MTNLNDIKALNLAETAFLALDETTLQDWTISEAGKLWTDLFLAAKDATSPAVIAECARAMKALDKVEADLMEAASFRAYVSAAYDR